MKSIEYSFLLVGNKNFAMILDYEEVKKDVESVISGSLSVIKKQFLIKTIKGNFSLNNLDYKTIHALTDKKSPVHQSMLVLVVSYAEKRSNNELINKVKLDDAENKLPFEIIYQVEFSYKIDK